MAAHSAETFPSKVKHASARYFSSFRKVWVQYLSIILLVMSIASLYSAIQTNIHLESVVACQSRVNTQLIQVLNSRTNAITAHDDATVAMVEAVLKAKSATDTQKALNDYVLANNAAKTSRRKNPLPAPPDEVCR